MIEPDSALMSDIRLPFTAMVDVEPSLYADPPNMLAAAPNNPGSRVSVFLVVLASASTNGAAMATSATSANGVAMRFMIGLQEAESILMPEWPAVWRSSWP